MQTIYLSSLESFLETCIVLAGKGISFKAHEFDLSISITGV